MKNVAGICEKTYLSLLTRIKKIRPTNYSKSFGPGLGLALARCWPSAARLSVPIGRMRRHSGSAGRLGVLLPTDTRTLEGTTNRGGSERGGSERAAHGEAAQCVAPQ